MRSGRGVRRAAVVALLLATGGISAGCDDSAPDPPPSPAPGAEPTVDVGRAQQEYHPLVAGVVEAVAEVSVPGRPDGDPEVIYYDAALKSCVFGSQRYEFDTVFGEDVPWDDVRAAAAEVLEPEGFELSDELDIPGGHQGFDATTDAGARLEVRAKLGQPSTISLDAPVAGDCDREVSETLPAMPGS